MCFVLGSHIDNSDSAVGDRLQRCSPVNWYRSNATVFSGDKGIIRILL